MLPVMSVATETFAAGVPVEIGKIDRELKKLWKQGGEVMTRASLINLAVYSEAPGSLAANTQIISRITEDHACRAIVIGANPDAAEEQVEAWLNAHCHISRAGGKQICSEQLSFSITGRYARLLPNIVFSHLDSDLPFYLWWQGEFCDPMDPQLCSWVDRLLYDSQTWSDFAAQMRLVEVAQTEARQRVVLCDLNWIRLVQMRLALAQFFDHPASQLRLAEINRLEICFAPGFRSTALLLVGWLAAQLGWKSARDGNKATCSFTNLAGKTVNLSLEEAAGEPIHRCSIVAGKSEFRVTHRADADLLEMEMKDVAGHQMQQLMPAGTKAPEGLVSEELMRGGPHRVYLRAINAVRELL